jgi:hypothetical protein
MDSVGAFSKVSISFWQMPSVEASEGRQKMDKIRIAVEELPELETEVAISGSVKQQEVGGGICLGVAAGIAIYLGY